MQRGNPSVDLPVRWRRTEVAMTIARWQWVFWCVLLAFLAWDWTHSAPVDLRQEPPLIAAGSGQQASGGHCSMAK